jgi:hypothetical protein
MDVSSTGASASEEKSGESLDEKNLLARSACAYTAALGIGFFGIWVYISSSSSSDYWN